MVRVGKICGLSINYVLCTIPSAENKNHEKTYATSICNQL